MSGRSSKMLRKCAVGPEFNLLQREVLANLGTVSGTGPRGESRARVSEKLNRRGERLGVTRVSPRREYRRLKREYARSPQKIKRQFRKQFEHILRTVPAPVTIKTEARADREIRSLRIGSWKARLVETAAGLFRVEIPAAKAETAAATEAGAIAAAKKWNAERTKTKKQAVSSARISETPEGPKIGI